MPETSIQDLESCNELITDILISKDTEKNENIFYETKKYASR